MQLRRAESHISGLIPIAVVLIGLQFGCVGDDAPKLEAWQDEVFQPITVSGYEIEGTRDGATTRAVAKLSLETGDQLELELELFYDPTPVLAAGRWSMRGEQLSSGELLAESLRFTGGQGDGVSVGGRFRLEERGALRYRVELPMRTIGRESWDPNADR